MQESYERLLCFRLVFHQWFRYKQYPDTHMRLEVAPGRTAQLSKTYSQRLSGCISGSIGMSVLRLDEISLNLPGSSSLDDVLDPLQDCSKGIHRSCWIQIGRQQLATFSSSSEDGGRNPRGKIEAMTQCFYGCQVMTVARGEPYQTSPLKIPSSETASWFHISKRFSLFRSEEMSLSR